jgi:spore maturation protein CgeB
VGHSYSYRAEYIRFLKENGINVKWFGPHSDLGSIDENKTLDVINRSKIVLNFSRSSQGDSTQMKVRLFESTGCGAFTLTEETDYLDQYFEIDKEIATFKLGSKENLLDKVLFYLKDQNRRETIANNGYQRAFEYSYQKIFMGLLAK